VSRLNDAFWNLLLVLTLVAVLVGVFTGCDSVGAVTGGNVVHEGSLTDSQVDAIQIALVLYVCPRLREQTGYACTANLLEEGMRELHFYWLGSGIDYRLEFQRPDD
jgi:hypothetical protein